jgi:D-alanine-D-alanine ligase
VYGAAESLNDALDAELAVAKALEDLGFTTEIMEVELELASIETLPSRRPLLVFNLVDAINCDGRFAPLATARLDALGIAYTGSNTSALLKTLSKVGTKLKLRQAGLPTPEWSADGTGLDAQVIVKALWEHGSLGLDKTSVMSCEEAQQVVVARTLSHKTEHFAEAYIDGREFNLSLIEYSSRVEVLPIAEILFEGLEANAPKIVDFDAKWTPDSRVYIGTPRRFGLERNEPELAEKLKQLALASWNLFGLNGYARVDFRIDPTGKPFVIDVNPNPFLAQDAGFAAAAAEAGLSYQDLIGRIVELAWRFARQGTWFAA